MATESTMLASFTEPKVTAVRDCVSPLVKIAEP